MLVILTGMSPQYIRLYGLAGILPQQKIHHLSYLCVKVTNIELQTIQIFNLQQMTKPEILV